MCSHENFLAISGGDLDLKSVFLKYKEELGYFKFSSRHQ